MTEQTERVYRVTRTMTDVYLIRARSAEDAESLMWASDSGTFDASEPADVELRAKYPDADARVECVVEADGEITVVEADDEDVTA